MSAAGLAARQPAAAASPGSRSATPSARQEETFWAGRLSKLQQQRGGTSPASPTSPAARIPALHGGPLAVIPTPQQPCAAPSSEAALNMAAQVEALKLQVATLRRANAQLSRELAALGAQQARAARAAALERLTQLESSGAAAGAASQASAEARAAAAALQAELGVALPPGSEAVPLQYLQRLHASYQARLGELQAAQAAALDQQQQEHEAALRRQVRAASWCAVCIV